MTSTALNYARRHDIGQPNGEARAAGPRVLQVVLSLSPGGTERLVVELATRLHPAYPMTVCCLDEPGSWADELERQGIPVFCLGRRPGFSPSLGHRIAQLANRFNVRVLHCHHYSPFVYGALARVWRQVGIIYTEHGRLSDAPPSKKRWVVNQLLGRVPDEIVSVSEDLRQCMVAEGFADRRVRVITNGIQVRPLPALSDRLAARAEFGASEGEFVIGAIGRLDPVKDLATLVRSFAELRQAIRARLVFIGDGPERAALVDRVAQAGLSDDVLFMGYRPDVPALLPGLDAYVNSSVFEGISLTILEAMAARVPLVATRVGGTPEIVSDGQTGWLVPARSPSEMTAALRRILEDPATARSVAAGGRQRVEREFSIEQMVGQYAAIYDRFEVR